MVDSPPPLLKVSYYYARDLKFDQYLLKLDSRSHAKIEIDDVTISYFTDQNS